MKITPQSNQANLFLIKFLRVAIHLASQSLKQNVRLRHQADKKNIYL